MVTVRVISGSGAPSGGSAVGLYLWPEDPPSSIGSTFTLEPLASGWTDERGVFSTPVAVPASAAEVDAGADSFAVVVLARSGAEQGATTETVIPGTEATVEVDTEPADSASTATLAAIEAETVEPVTVKVVDEGYRYIRILAYNCAKGMSCDLTYRVGSSDTRETKAQVAISYGGTWSAGGFLLEETSREGESHWKQTGAYHRYVWANYKWVKYAFSCAHCNPWWEWHLHHWQGTISDYNPNKNKSGQTIGTVKYSPPPLDRDRDHRVVLNADNSPWKRATGQYQEYGFQLSFADFLGLKSKATYATNTLMTWKAVDGCSGERWLWGDGVDPYDAPIVQASCVV